MSRESAAIGAVAGSLLNQHLEAEPCFTFLCVETSVMPAEFAFLGNRIASGLMTPMHGHHDGVAEMLIDTAAALAIWWTTRISSLASRPTIRAGAMSVLLTVTLFVLRTWVRWTSP